MKNGIIIPEHELEVTTARAGGPGGQHVNKTNTKIIIKWNVNKTNALNEHQKQRLLEKLQSDLTIDGEIVIQNSSTRSQLQNKKLAYDQLTQKIRKALYIPKKRKKTGIPKGAKEKRLKSKKVRSVLKRMRSKKDFGD
jgi:ribosome-associated protein